MSTTHRLRFSIGTPGDWITVDPARFADRDAVQEAAGSLSPDITDAQISIDPATCPVAQDTDTDVVVTISYPMPFLTGFFGATVDLTGRGVMRCQG